jgi:hypothetical protein
LYDHRSITVSSDRKKAFAAQKRQQWQQRQSQNGKMIAVDTLEQMDAEPLQLVGADA